MPPLLTIEEIIDLLVAAGGSRAESFFIDQGLGRAYASVGKGWGIRKHVNAGLLAAEKEGRQDEVLDAAAARFGDGAARLAKAPQRAGRASAAPARQAANGKAIGKLFVSHASVDVDLANAVADLLRLGTNLSGEAILCTSLEGMGIPEGTSDYVGFLRTELADARLVLPLLTPAFLDSDVCLIELGAMWGMQLPAFPLVVPPVTFARIEVALGKIQGARIDSTGSLDRLRDRVVDAFDLRPRTDLWSKYKKRFEAELPALCAGLAKAQRVPAEDLTAAQKAASAAKNRATKLKREYDELKARFDEVVALKDRDEVGELMVPASERKRFDHLAAAARDAMTALPSVARRALYENLGRDRSLYVEGYDVDDADQAVRNDLLAFNEDEGGYWYNDSDPEIAAAVDAVADLFDRTWSDELLDTLKERHKKVFSKQSEPTWKALGLL